MLLLNWDIAKNFGRPTPSFVAKLIRPVVHASKGGTRAFMAFCRSLIRRIKRSRTYMREDLQVNTEAIKDEEKSSVEEALVAYRHRLEEAFGSSERIGDVMYQIETWTKG